MSTHLNASTDPIVDYAWFSYGKPQTDKALAATMDANYEILNSNAPAALAEGLFMSNTEAQVLLASTDTSSRRQRIAEQLVAGIRAFAGR